MTKVEKNRIWRLNNPGYYDRYRIKRREYDRTARLQLRYGITEEVYQQMFYKQEGKCAVCFRHQSQLSTRLCVDHNHQTKKIRGLLCRNCNRYVIGLLENTPHLIHNGQIYLSKYSEVLK